MNKLWIIIRREYLSRVTSKAFLLATLLTPIGFAVFFVVVGLIFSYEGGNSLRIAVTDRSQMLGDNGIKSENDGSINYILVSLKDSEIIEKIKKDEYDAWLELPSMGNPNSKQYNAFVHTDEKLSLDDQMRIETAVEKILRTWKIAQFKLDEATLASLDTDVSIDPQPIDASQKDVSTVSSIVAAGIGSLMGMIMYIAVFIYGIMVMRGVMEEKTNRIVEVVISSVKPFELMLGKIVGIGAVGLTQVLIWSIIIPVMYMILIPMFGINPPPPQMGAGQISPADMAMAQDQAYLFIEELGSQNWWSILPLFLVYFLGGYFLYASMFAAIGSAIGDDMSESNSLTLPVSIPIVLAVYIMITVVKMPDSNLAIWSSIFPLFSPIVMPARLAFSPPWWQVLLSVVVLLGTSAFFVWLAGKIYRVGILLYGKKASFKEISKWIFTKV